MIIVECEISELPALLRSKSW